MNTNNDNEQATRPEGDPVASESNAAEQTAEQPAGGAGGPDAGRGPEPEPHAPRDHVTWAELEEHLAALRAEHAAYAEQMEALTQQTSIMRGVLEQLATYATTLGVEEDLIRLCDQVLGGLGTVQRLRSPLGFSHGVSLFWDAQTDPRPSLARPGAPADYVVNVLLYLGDDGRPRVRVEGAKRLEAPLPTSRTRLRGVLLQAIQNPRLVSQPGAEPEEQPATAQPATDDEEHRRRREPHHEDGTPDLPAEEMVIPLGPSESEGDR